MRRVIRAYEPWVIPWVSRMVTARCPGLRCQWNPRTDAIPRGGTQTEPTVKYQARHARTRHDQMMPFVHPPGQFRGQVPTRRRHARNGEMTVNRQTGHRARDQEWSLQMSHETASTLPEEMPSVRWVLAVEPATVPALKQRTGAPDADAANTAHASHTSAPVQPQYVAEVTQIGRYKKLIRLYRNITVFSSRHAVIRVLAAACAGACMVSACGGGGTSGSAVVTGSSSSVAATSSASPNPTPVVAPGYNTPEDAVDGLLQAELAGNGSELCSYLLPGSQSVCDQDEQASPLPAFTGSAMVDGDVMSGSEALVAVTGSICSSGSGCTSNSDPTVGMPNDQETFAQAYGQAMNSSGSFSAVPCIEENGMWYVNTNL
jgi:hypothetical protein